MYHLGHLVELAFYGGMIVLIGIPILSFIFQTTGYFFVILTYLLFGKGK